MTSELEKTLAASKREREYERKLKRGDASEWAVLMLAADTACVGDLNLARCYLDSEKDLKQALRNKEEPT